MSSSHTGQTRHTRHAGPKRIVLVDTLGDVLFSGESMIASETRAASARASIEPAERSDDECPETLRSTSDATGSGVFRAVDRVRVNAVFEADAEVETEIPTLKKTA